MTFELLSKKVFLNAVIATERPVAFLVGAPLSLKDNIGVPGVTEILELVREKIRGRIPHALPDFETELRGKTGGDAYQAAMKWLGNNTNQDAINDVVKKAVLKARKTATPELSGSDGEPADWNMPSGTANLGELITRVSERFRGPVLTTNFDPLISLAARAVGGRTGRRVLTADGTLAGSAEDDICSIIHLHGFWRDSDTLHTQAQLTNPRPKLTKSLQRLLHGHTLVVAAYGGWDDVFTRALMDIMNDEGARLDVIWCFYEHDADKVQAQHAKLLAAVEPAIVMNRFRAFGGIDCHSIFGEILATLRSTSPTAAAPAIASPLAGWELIDAVYLGALEPLRPEEVVRYFDGATPTWRHAVCPDIPSRNDVNEIAKWLEEARNAKDSCSLRLIRAAGGEGKSTLLLQAAAVAAKSGAWHILWRPAPRHRLSPEHIAALNPDKNWLIVADDAENLVTDLGETARLLHETGRSNVHFLVAARDSDWKHFHGDRKPWNTLMKKYPDILLRELIPVDAALLVEAWKKYGTEGLRELACLPDKDQQVAKLLEAVHEPAAVRDEGSFFGGLLAVRFGPDGLRGHVVDMLNRLKERQIQGSERTLFDALVYVAACHAVGMPGLDEKVLADLLDVPDGWLQMRVVNPLGEEAAAVRSAGHVHTRHSKVAAAILVAAEQDLGADVAEIWSAIVRQTVRTGKLSQMDKHWYSNILHSGPRLQRNLPQQFSEQRRKEIAVAAAKADIAVEPDRLCSLVDLGKTYRNAGDYPAAVQVFRQHVQELRTKADYHSDIRGYWYEWGVAEGSARDTVSLRAADAWLQGLSLADHLKPALITHENAKLICAGLGVAFGKLAEAKPDCPFALARRTAAYLGRLTNPDPKTLGYFDKHDREADKICTPHPQDIGQAVAWLKAAVTQAGRELQDPFLKGLLKPEQVSFNMLREFFEPKPAPARTNQRAAAPSDSPTPKTGAMLLQLKSGAKDSEDKIKAGIERALTNAWQSVPAAMADEERLKTAKRNVSKAIDRLSPSIKTQVRKHFDELNWEPLKACDPKTRQPE